MKPIGKSFSAKALQNLLLSFQGIRYEKQIKDKPRKVTDYHYCLSNPKVRKNPHVAGLSKRVLDMLGYDQQLVLKDQQTPYYLSGSKLIQGSVPIAHNYCGHQFGVWAGQLGDGRAHTIGHVKNEQINKIYELQLKGSGLSPFSRHADGNSVVSSAVRQFLVSQLMAGIGIPTTRALSLVFADEQVIRDPFYNGKIKIQNAAIIIRVAQSFLRFGSFQVCNKDAQLYKQNPLQNRKILKSLADYLHKYIYTQIDEQQGDIYQQIFKKIVIKSSQLVAKWQSIGFVHGVLNTDNMSMINVTIDYGPFGFIDYFSKDFVSNATDQHQRYSYRRQPQIVKWNLYKLAQAFDILVPYNILKKYIQELFYPTFLNMYNKKMANKLGLQASKQSIQLINELLQIMHICGSNFTNTFRILAQNNENTQNIIQKLLNQSLPTQFYKKSLRILQNPISAQQIQAICQHDNGFNKQFLTQQSKRYKLLHTLIQQTCQQRTKREKQLWINWYNKYIKLLPNRKLQQQNTLQYVLLNQVAKNITEQMIKLKPQEQRELINKILEVFSNPYKKNQWFESKYWSRRPIPVRLTCSS